MLLKKNVLKTNSKPEIVRIMKTIMDSPIFKINVIFLWAQNTLSRTSRNFSSTIFSFRFAVVRC